MDQEETLHDFPQPAEKRLNAWFDWVGSAVTALVAVALLFAFAFRMVSVDGESMTNTLQNGDRLLISGTFYTPDYGDVVVVTRVGDAPLIKRVIGLPGDRIRIEKDSGVVYRNDQPLEEPYTRDGFTPTNGMASEVTVPEGHLFVLGDNRRDSLDSRMIGPVSMENVVGRALFRIAPNPAKLTNGE